MNAEGLYAVLLWMQHTNRTDRQTISADQRAELRGLVSEVIRSQEGTK